VERNRDALTEQRLRELSRRVADLERRVPADDSLADAPACYARLEKMKNQLDQLRSPAVESFNVQSETLAAWLREEHASLEQQILDGHARRAYLLQQDQRMRGLARDFQEVTALGHYSDLGLTQDIPALEPRLAAAAAEVTADALLVNEMYQQTQALAQTYRATMLEFSEALVKMRK
jgi:hypothetical protein